MILFQCLQGCLEGGWCLRDGLCFLWRQLVEVLVHWSVWLDAVLDAVQAGQHHGSEAEVWVAGWVRSAELQALGLRVGAGDWDTHGCGAVALGVHEVDWSLEAWHQAVVGVQGWVGECQHCACVLQDAADVVASHVGESGVAVLVVEQWLAVLPQGLVGVHAGAVVACQWLWHEGGGYAVLPCGVLDDVLEGLQVISCVQQRVELVVDLLLAAGAHLVVCTLQVEASVAQVAAHFVAQVLVVVVWSGREVAALWTGFVAQVWGAVEVGLGTAVPPALFGVNLVEGLVHLGGVAHVVEEVELCLCTEEAGVCDSGGVQVLLCLAGNVAWVAGEWLAGEGVVDEELHVQRLGLAEWIDFRGGEIREQVHVGLFDGGESADGRAVECHAVFDCILVECVSGDGEVLLLAWHIGEADVDEFNVVVLDVLNDFFRSLE